MNPVARMAARPSVLIVDDKADNIQVLGQYLTQAYDVRYALSGPEALALLAEARPDLILLDVMMPGMDGYAVCGALKSDPRTSDIPVIFVTARSDADAESRALETGAVDFIHKPVNPEVVRARVGLHLMLKSRERELRALNEELVARVEARTQALNEALLREEAAYRAKAQFLANVNHELRTPMNVILGLSSVVAADVGDPLVPERIHKIERAARQLLRVVDDIIDMADLQAGSVRIEAVPFDLNDVLNELDRVWCVRAEAKGLRWERVSDPAVPSILHGDPRRLRQVIGNLLGNAVKFSERGTVALRIHVAQEGERGLLLRFEVEDQGIGIGAEQQEGIFRIFEQADSSRTRRFNGTGLGLPLCKSLVELMGGTMGLESHPGRGSLFWFSLPFAAIAEVSPARPAPEPMPAASPEADWFQLLQIFTPLMHQLAEEDVQAYLTWRRGLEVLDAALGPLACEFDAAMQVLDFPAALKCLRSARSTWPELTELKPDG